MGTCLITRKIFGKCCQRFQFEFRTHFFRRLSRKSPGRVVPEPWHAWYRLPSLLRAPMCTARESQSARCTPHHWSPHRRSRPADTAIPGSPTRQFTAHRAHGGKELPDPCRHVRLDMKSVRNFQRQHEIKNLPRPDRPRHAKLQNSESGHAISGVAANTVLCFAALLRLSGNRGAFKAGISACSLHASSARA